MKTNPNDSLEELRRETSSLLELAKNLLTELDALEFPVSRPIELALELRERLRRREQEILTDQLVAASAASEADASASAPSAEPDVAPPSTHWETVEPKVALEWRTAQINPRTAICWNGAYAEEFLDQVQCSLALVWAPPDFSDAVPDWAMRITWAEFADEWDELLKAAWERW